MHSQRPFSRIAAALVVGILLFPTAALAATIATQDVQDTQSGTFSSNAIQQNLGNTLGAAAVKSVAIKIGVASSTIDFLNNYILILDLCNFSYSTCQSVGTFLANTLSGTGVATFSASSPITLQANNYYRTRITLAAEDTVFGSATSTALGGGSFRQQNGTPDPNIADMAVRLCDTYTCDLTPPDTEAPVLSGTPSDIIAEATSTAGASVTYTPPTATDNIDGTDAVSCTPAPDTLFTMGSTTVTCSAADAAGNATSTTFMVGVYDTTAPALSGTPADTTVEATAASTTVTYSSPTATDLVDGAVTVSCSPASGWGFSLGSTTVTCNATDAAGNATSSAFVVGVVDTIAPMVTLNGDATVSLTVGDTFTDLGATSTDLGTPATVTTAGSVDTATAGTYTLTYSAADASGNTASTTRTVTVVEPAPPPPPPPPPSSGGNGPPIQNPSQGLPQGLTLGVETQAVQQAAAAAAEAIVQAAPPVKISAPSTPQKPAPAVEPQPASDPQPKVPPPAPATIGPWEQFDSEGSPLSAAAINANQGSSPVLPLTIGVVLLISLGALARRWM